MKKFLSIASILLLVCSSAYAMDLMENESLADVDAQAGIRLQNYTGAMTVGISLEGISWGDPDGAQVGTSTNAGHVKIHALTASALAVSTLGINISQPVGNTVTLNVDASGIFVNSGTTNITVAPPPVLRISVGAGSVGTWGVPANESVTLGDLGLGALSITVSTPSVLKISPVP